MHFSLTSAATLLLLAAIDVQAHHIQKFTISARFPAEGNCSTADQVQLTDDKGALIKDGHCETFAEFRYFHYQLAAHSPEEDPEDYGVCGLAVWSEPECNGMPVFVLDDANSQHNLGRCYGNFNAHNHTTGRSISVGRCMTPAKKAEIMAFIAKAEADAKKGAEFDVVEAPSDGEGENGPDMVPPKL